ncbi:cysteine-rich KTR domain-containing protein [uncultured Allofournierella sp.]|uniref:cysteine-rich KTR domain-containing protein n=1 Tax=uncultured Allofournierella sp. TaxID=1940258 RepID=UPI0025DC329B|nr:cysteine-rich KTR domain-containing protein [uncultured Fournierella sp.]
MIYSGSNKQTHQKESLWIHCPLCGGKTRTKVYKKTVLINFPLYCPKCKREIQVDVVNLKMVLSEEPDA